MRKLQIAAGIVLGFILFSQAFVLPAFAQDGGPTDDDVNAIARGLYCPVCENIPLDVCPTQACEQWRATIREKLVLGWSDDQIKDYFADQYGPRVLAEPPAEGFNLLVYILPPVLFIIGGFILYRAVRVWRVETPAPEGVSVESDDPYIAQLEQELRQRDE
ncbi:MAG: cytochrome c-type biogenesis protein CcmH [Anaerolineales bacterium]|nr:cytochrome c-type biogenesis protein CcmH [Anaerolineales bacterium]